MRKALNETVPQALALLPEAARPEVTHQTGAQHLEAVRAGYAAAGVRAETLAFIDDMAARYGDADVVICRAGALTIAELACAGVASILVPFPFAVDDHQTGNANFLAARGAAILLPQAELTAQRLADLLRGLTRERLLDMAEKAKVLGQAGRDRGRRARLHGVGAMKHKVKRIHFVGIGVPVFSNRRCRSDRA